MSLYADLELSLHHLESNRYQVDFRFSQPESDADIRLGQDEPAIAEFNIEALAELLPSPDSYANALTQALFKSEALRTAFAQARASAQSQNVPLRMRLFIGATAPELHNLRWELLRDPQENTPLSTDPNILFSRYLSSLDWRPVRLKPQGNLRALVAVANPSDLANYKLPNLDLEAELLRAQNGLGDTSKEILSNVQHPSTLNNIMSSLRNASVDIFYLVCHGLLVNGQPILYLENETGKTERVLGIDLVTRLKELEERPRLVVLASCQSGGKPGENALSALGPRLAEIGIPAVLAMQDNLSMETANTFISAFFKELLCDGQIDRAVSVARGLVRERSDAWVPCLTTRLKSGRLWYVPGFSDRSAGADFETEIRYIQRERCTPIIGPGLIESIIGTTRDMAIDLSSTFNFPMAPFNRDALPKVMQFLATDKGDAVPFDEYEDYIRKYLLSNFEDVLPSDLTKKARVGLDDLVNEIGIHRRNSDTKEAYSVLARLPFPIYIVATPDRLIEDALHEAGRQPEVIISPWNARLAQRKTVFDLRPDYEPSAENPLVFYLFGRWNERNSMVLTEDEYIRYLIGFTSNKAFVPEQVRLALSDTLLLFLGFQTEEWAFRVIFHSILAQAGSELLGQYAHIAVQIEPEDERTLEPLHARRYLEKYFIKGANINVFWGQAEEYLSGLIQKWEGRRA